MIHSLRHFPLGDTVTGSPHSVCLSLPAMADVIGYEERAPRVLDAVQSGYPRFFEHPLVREASGWFARRHDLGDQRVYLCDSLQAVRDAVSFARAGTPRILEADGFAAITIDARDRVCNERVGKFLQHTGVRISSRQAEDYLLRLGAREQAFPEQTLDDDPGAEVRRVLHGFYGTARPADIHLCRGGMNAFYAGFRAVQELQRPEGREIWIQLGWLYVDTMRILEHFTADPVCRIEILRVDDLDTLEEYLEECGDEVAGIVTEVPTNPLVQTTDLPRLRALADHHGIALILDPTIASPHNVNILPYADLHINSLTKYAGSEGDVMIGAVALNPRSRFYEGLAQTIGTHVTPPYARDLARLAHEIQAYEFIVEKVNGNTPLVVEALERHPAVRSVAWALSPSQEARYRMIAHQAAGAGCIVTLSLQEGRMHRFYDRIRMAKSPSFGTVFSMLCPFLYLAHYDLVREPAGRSWLRSVGMDPDLIRLSVGTEPPAEIIATLADALAD